MNLAEIRKKAGDAKKTLVEDLSAQLADTEADFFAAEPVSSPVTEPEPVIDFVELADSGEEEPLALEEQPLPPEAEAEVLQAGAWAAIAAAVEEPEETPLAVPQPVPSAMSVEAAKPAPALSGYNPLAAILTGRREAVDAEDDAQFQQQALYSDDVEEYLCFRVASEEYALSIMAIKEIIKPREVTEVPRMPAFVRGVISLRGVIVPVMDMRLRLSLTQGAVTGRERIIVLRTDAGFCGVLVDEVVQVARILKTDIEDPPAVLEDIDRDFVRGIGHYDNRMLILLNLEAITDISVC